MAVNCVISARKQEIYENAISRDGARGSNMTRATALGARGTVRNASREGLIGNCSLPEYPGSASMNACSRESHLSGSSWLTLPRTRTR